MKRIKEAALALPPLLILLVVLQILAA